MIKYDMCVPPHHRERFGVVQDSRCDPRNRTALHVYRKPLQTLARYRLHPFPHCGLICVRLRRGLIPHTASPQSTIPLLSKERLIFLNDGD